MPSREPAGSPARLIHLDAVGGVAGDMFVAAMLDAFPDLWSRVRADLAAVLPPELGEPALVPGFPGGVRALRFGLPEPKPLGDAGPDDRHRHGGHGQEGHGQTGEHESGPRGRGGHGHARNEDAHHGHDHPGHGHHAHGHSHGSRDTGHPSAHAPHGTRFTDLVARIEAAALADGTAREAVAILTVLAAAEAHIHGVPVEDVHFHEVGDWDSLMDVVAAGSIAAALRPARWTVSDLPRGGGLVKTQHGLLPVPAPATAAILTGFSWRDDGVVGERVTPTGAAIIRHLCDPAPAPAGPSGKLVATGTGAGTRDLAGMPNVLRAIVFEAAPQAGREMIDIVTFEIDDMTGEEIAVAAGRLRTAAGVVDLVTEAVSGKKGRPACRFQLLCRPGHLDGIAAEVFSETSTLGLRSRSEVRILLPREAGISAGRRVKKARRPGGTVTVKLESDELAGVAGLAARRAIAREAETGETGDD